jgi:PKD repeat protein
VPVPPNHSYAAGNWTVTLTVTDANGQSNTGTRPVSVTTAIPQCTVPNFTAGSQKTSDQIQVAWTNAGFNTTVIFNPSRPPEFNIQKQNPAPGLAPCSGTVLTLSKNN